MNDCAALQSYLARLLRGDELARFEQHLAQCAACRAAVTQSSQLDARLASALASMPQPTVTERVARELTQAAQRPTPPRAPRVWAAAALATAVAVIALRWPPSRSRGTSSTTTTPTAVAAVPLTVLFNEGGAIASAPSQRPRAIEVPREGRLVVRAGDDVLGIGARTRAEILATDTHHARVRLGVGLIAVQAAHRTGDSSLVIEAGRYTVTVVGTRFSVTWDGLAQLAVLVAEGQVRVTEPDGQQRMVRAGQSLHRDRSTDARLALAALSAQDAALLEQTLRTTPATASPDERPASPTPATVAPAPLAPALSAPAPSRARPAPPPDEATIRRWLIEGDAARAERALRARLAIAPRESGSWWLLGETHRRAGAPRAAVDAYQRVIELGDPSEANRARYQSALLLEERLGDGPRAISLYRAYLTGSPRPLEAAAQLRLGRMLIARGEGDGRALLEALVRRHRGTPEAEQAARLLAGG